MESRAHFHLPSLSVFSTFLPRIDCTSRNRLSIVTQSIQSAFKIQFKHQSSIIMNPIYFRRPSQEYDTNLYSMNLNQNKSLINVILDIRASPAPCQHCITNHLYHIASNLHGLCDFRPSDSIAQEVVDLQKLNLLSRALLEIDGEGITSAVWELINRKVRSLSNSHMARA